jgi:hypothetical protein
VTVANGHSIEASHIGKLQIPSGHSIVGYIFPGINGSLLSISSFVDIGYIVSYSSVKVTFALNEKVIFEGLRDPISKLWMVDLALFQKPVASAAPAVEVNSPAQLVSFWHAAFGYPTKSSFIRHIRNGNIKVDGLSMEVVRKHFVPSIYTALGHLDATRANIKSTKDQIKPEKKIPEQPSIFVATYETTGRVHGDQTGALPVMGRHKE